MSDRTYTDAEIEAALNGELPGEEEEVEEEAPPAEEADEDDESEAPVEEHVSEEEVTEEEVTDDWEQKAKKIQAAKDREIAAIQAENQRLREEAAERRGREAAQQEYQESTQTEQFGSVTPEDLRPGMESDLPGTFQWTVAHRPDLVPALISMVRTSDNERLGHPVADQMVVEYADFRQQQAIHLQEQKWQELTAQQEADKAPLRSQAAMEDVVGGLTERFGENFTAVQDEIAKRLETDGRGYVEYLREEAIKSGEDPNAVVTPELMKEMMVDIYLEIREEALNGASAEPQKPTPVPAAAGGIGGNTSNHEVTDENNLDDFITGAIKGDMSIDPQFLP